MIKKIIIFSDLQFPFHDKRADEVLNKFLDDFKPDICVFNGDGLDCPSISNYDRDPKRTVSLAKEIEGFREYIKVKNNILPSDCVKHFNEGNHEDRLRRFLWRKAPELVGLRELETPVLLGLDGWGFTPYWDADTPGFDAHGLLVIHGWTARAHSGQTAKACFDHFGGSGVTGHTHRLGTFYHRNYHGSGIWLEGGCLCGTNPPYVQQPSWEQGIIAGWIHTNEDDGIARYDINTVPIVNGKLRFGGVEYRA